MSQKQSINTYTTKERKCAFVMEFIKQLFVSQIYS